MAHDLDIKNITIRPVMAGDLDTVCTLLEQEAEHNGFSFSQDSPYHPENAAVAIVNASLNDDDPNCGWLAFSDGEAAGIITTPQELAGGVFVSETFRAGKGLHRLLCRKESAISKKN